MEEGIAPVLSSFKSREIVIVPRLTVDIEYRYITVNIVRVKMKKRNSFFFFLSLISLDWNMLIIPVHRTRLLSSSVIYANKFDYLRHFEPY